MLSAQPGRFTLFILNKRHNRAVTAQPPYGLDRQIALALLVRLTTQRALVHVHRDLVVIGGTAPLVFTACQIGPANFDQRVGLLPLE